MSRRVKRNKTDIARSEKPGRHREKRAPHLGLAHGAAWALRETQQWLIEHVAMVVLVLPT